MLIFSRVCALPLLWLTACSSVDNRKDPVLEAAFQNERRIGEEAVTKRQIKDAEFVVHAASRKMLMLEISQLAQRKAASPDARYTAQGVAAQATTLLNQLQALAQQKKLVLPTGLGEAQAAQAGELTALNGPAFDQAYAKTLGSVLDTDEEATDDMTDEAYDVDVRTLSARQVATLKDLQSAAEALHDKLNP
jgi:putative membrane protein